MQRSFAQLDAPAPALPWLAPETTPSLHGVPLPAADDAAPATPYRYVLLLRYVLVNLTGFAFLVAAWLQGWIGQILAADTTHICKLIFALFVVGLVWAGQKVGTLSRELNALDAGPGGPPTKVGAFLHGIAGRDGGTRAALAMALRLKLAHRIAPIR